MPASAPLPLWRAIPDATVFGVTGIALLIVGYYVSGLVTPYNRRRELQENKNLAVAVVAPSFVVGMAIVVASALVHFQP